MVNHDVSAGGFGFGCAGTGSDWVGAEPVSVAAAAAGGSGEALSSFAGMVRPIDALDDRPPFPTINQSLGHGL
jgi:hypothetical protein